MTPLPIYEIEDDLVAALQAEPRLIVQAPTGSGKSTQVPQMLLDHGLADDGQIIVLQPRRLPTRMLARRVAQERRVRLGDEVGYQIRFDNVSSPNTRIKFVTEGVLLRMMLDDPNLNGVAALVFDEFHERHLFGDISLGRALQLQTTFRSDLKLIVMSATLQAETLADYLSPCRILTSEGRTFPVDVHYLDRQPDPRRTPIWELAARETDRLLSSGEEGDALIFMPGAYEIHRTIQALQGTPAGRQARVLPLHGELSVADQDAALESYGQRKIIVSTNVAETSLTIEGIRVVVDSGLARMARFDPFRGINTLLVEKISQASADQRGGRAGRTAPGVCLRLWTEKEHRSRAPAEPPEIRRLDLSEILLTLKASGITEWTDFPWLDAPEPRSLERAESLLKDLGALHPHTREITPTGRRMVSFPTHPRYSRMLLAGADHQCLPSIALAAALTQSREILIRRVDSRTGDKREDTLGKETESDFFLLIRAWQHAASHRFSVPECEKIGVHANAARQAGQTFRQLLDIARRQGLDTDDDTGSGESFRKCLLLGFSDHVAVQTDSATMRCRLTHGRRGVLARETAVRNARLLVATEIREIDLKKGEVTVLLNQITAIEEAWLTELFPDEVATRRQVRFDSVQRRVMSRTEKVFRDLVLDASDSDDVSDDDSGRALAEEIINGKGTLKNWNHGVEQWIARLNCLSRWMPELEMPSISSDDRRYLTEQICHGARSLREVKDRPVIPVVKSWLSREQQGWLDQFAPEQIELPRGRRPRIVYSEEAPPTISARVQDLYDLNDNLRIANDSVELVIQVLAPNQRPIQVTRDMSRFWTDSYPEIRKQLQGRYPKHEWR